MRYKNIGVHAEDTAEGATLAPGEMAGTGFDPEDPFNAAKIADGVFLAIDDEAEPEATDSAVALAHEHNVPLTAVTGSGAGGRITKEDVERHLGAIAAAQTGPRREEA